LEAIELPGANQYAVILLDQRFKEVDAELVSGVLHKPFEVAELGNLVHACVLGFTEELRQQLYVSKDRVIRDFVRGDDS
jgi:hypothetical protein